MPRSTRKAQKLDMSNLVKMARVMIADDSEDVRNVLKDMMLIGRHEIVAEAVDGIDTLDKFNSVKPDVLLLDIAMPKKDGLTALRELKKTNPDAKVIMITAYSEMSLIQDCVKEGALAYISKPFDTDEVLKSILFALEEK